MKLIRSTFLIVALLFAAPTHGQVPIPATCKCEDCKCRVEKSETSVLVPVANQDVVESKRLRDSREKALKIGAKRALLKLERQLRRDGDKDGANRVRKVRTDAELFEAFYHGKVEPSMVKAMGEDGETPIVDFWKWMLQFVVDNKDDILDFIKQIIDLFSVIEYQNYWNWVHFNQYKATV